MMPFTIGASDIVDSLAEGKAHYQKKDFQAALLCFHNALYKRDCSRILALDCRAATHINLGKLEAALRDGKSMIKENRADSRGYIRTARVLQLLNNGPMAATFYRYGMENVPASDPHYKLLKHLRETFNDESKKLDITALPIELAVIVFQYLDFKTILKVQRVSRSWQCLLCSIPQLWKHLDFSTAGKPIHMPALYAFIRRSQGCVNQASLIAKLNGDSVLRNVVSRCKALEHLELNQGFIGTTLVQVAPHAIGLKTLIVGHCGIIVDTISKLLGILCNLERAEFHAVIHEDNVPQWQGDLTKIRKLVMRSEKVSALQTKKGINLGQLLEKIPNAENLAFHNWSWLDALGPSELKFMQLTKLHTLTLSCCDWLSIPCLPSSLQNLDFGGSTDGSGDGMGTLKWSHLPELKILSMQSNHMLTASKLSQLLRPNKGNLESLDISGCGLLTEADVQSYLKDGFLTRITWMDLAGLSIGDATVELVASSCPHLAIAGFGSTRITGVGIKALVTKLRPTLQRLYVSHCPELSPDAVVWARSQKIIVDYNFPSDPKGCGARTVRDQS